ncbi:MAG: CoA-binding protein [Thermoproteota archaeon]
MTSTSIPPDSVSIERIKEILKNSKTIAIVGASRNPGKAAYEVPAFLKSKGYKIIPINPSADYIFGEKAYKSLLDLPDDLKIDVVDVFRPSNEVINVVKDAIKKGYKIIWLQEGIYDPEAVNLAKKNNIEIIWNRCMMKSYISLME